MSGNDLPFKGFEETAIGEIPNPFITTKEYGLRRKLDDSDDNGHEKKTLKKSRDMGKTKDKFPNKKISYVRDEKMDDDADTNDTEMQNISPATQQNTQPIDPTQISIISPKSKNRFKDEWIPNTVYTTFFIEKQRDLSTDQNQKQPFIHAMEVAKVLHNIEIKNYKELKPAGQGRFRITFSRPREAEVLINSKLLMNEFKYQVYVPNMFKQTIGVVRNVPVSFTDEEILANIKTANNKKVLKVERIQKMQSDKLVPTFSIKIYIDGQQLPDHISIFGVFAKVDYYFFPLKQCTKCLRYGHKLKACKSSKSRCESCGLEHDDKNCSAPPRCIHCNGGHKATDRNCPERLRQDKIRILMTTEKLTFVEAAKRFPKNNSVQHRLDSAKDFPSLPTSESHNSGLNTSMTTTHNMLVTPIVHEPQLQPKDLEKIIETVKQQLIEQLNLDKIFNKIKAIQTTIIKHTEQYKNKKNTIETDILLINISDQIKSIMEQEIPIMTIHNPS